MKSGKSRKSGKARPVSDLAMTAKRGQGIKGGNTWAGRAGLSDITVSKLTDASSGKLLKET